MPVVTAPPTSRRAPVTDLGAATLRRSGRHRILVIGPAVADTVRHAGGLVFDRVSAGWDVQVLLPGAADVRALRIVGAEVRDLEAGLPALRREPHPDVLLVGARLCADDERVHRIVRQAMGRRGAVDVRIWGAPCRTRADLADRAMGPVQHRLSRAARAFKAHALLAAAAPLPVEGCETFAVAGPPGR